MTVFIVRHVPGNTLGYLETTLRDAYSGGGVVYLDLSQTPYKGDILAWDRFQTGTKAVILLGGSMNADQDEQHDFLAPEKRWIQQLVQHHIPVLGICLGSQLLARSLGAAVTVNPTKEIGWTPIALTKEGLSEPVSQVLGQHQPQFQWHEDTWALPEGATLLGSTSACHNQIFRFNAITYGVQFHPEMTLESIQTWLNQSKSLSSSEKARILKDTHQYLPDYQAKNKALLQAFLKQAGVF